MIETLLLKFRNYYRKICVKIINRINNPHDKLPKSVNYFEGSLYDAVYLTALKYPYNTAIEYANNQITYKQLIRRIDRVAKGLKALGVKKGDYVTICMPNTPEAIYMFYAVNEIGAVANMIHPLSGEKEIEYYLNKSNSKVMLAIDVSYKKVKNIIDNTSLEKVIVISATKSMERIMKFLYWITKGRKLNVKESNKFILWNHFLHQSYKFKEEPYEKVKHTDAAVVLYSGGTTGKPKGVLLSNLSFNAQAVQAKYANEVIKQENAFLTFLPNFHAFGLGTCTHLPLYFGMRIVLIPQFNIKQFKKYLRKYKPNIICGVPTIYDKICDIKFRKNDLSCLKLCVCGGDAISTSLKERAEKYMAKYGYNGKIVAGYGLSETAGVISLSPDNYNGPSDVIGYPFPNVDFKFIDVDTDEEVRLGSEGEMIVSAPNVMIGYLNEIEETNKCIFYDETGKRWLRTGDIGFMDKKGLIHYKSRLKRLIITSGYNVYPAQVEDAIMSFGKIRECAVVGKKDESKGEIVVSYIVLDEGIDKNKIKGQLQKHLKEHLAKFEIPREIRYIDELPKNLLGKVMYKELEKLN